MGNCFGSPVPNTPSSGKYMPHIPENANGQEHVPHVEVPDDFLIVWDDIKMDDKIGQGGFGEVFKGFWQENRVAVKVLTPDRVTAELKMELRSEALLMSRLMHPCIARIFGLVDDGQHLAVVMQYYRQGTLEDFMTRPETQAMYQEWTLVFRLQIATMVAKGMKFLHDKKIVHADLKTSNILLDDVYRAYIADFGLAKALKKQEGLKRTESGSQKDYRMSIHIAAPEVLQNPGQERTFAADVYSFAIVLLEIMTGTAPFKGMNASMIQQVVVQGRRPNVPNDLPEIVQKIIKSCWDANIDRRPQFKDIVPMLDEAIETERLSGNHGMNATMIRQVCITGKRPTIPYDMPKSIKAIIEACWQQNPDQRPTFLQIVDMLARAMIEQAAAGDSTPVHSLYM